MEFSLGGWITMLSVKTAQARVRVTFTPALDAWPDAGVYQLWLRVARPLVVCVGRLGQVRFEAGMYIYTGRASRGLCARVLRHARGAQRLHWHIDYLLAQARLTHVLLASVAPEDECRVNNRARRLGWIAVPRFGASDCRHGCPGHLWRVG
jgi:Uri superfamily endonuclease